MCLGCSQTDQLGPAKAEGGNNKNVAETLEPVVKCAGISPVFTSYVTGVYWTAAVDYYTEYTAKRLIRMKD